MEDFKLTIIVPCYNEESYVATLLKKLDDLEVPGTELEVIVVDDGSQDRSWEIITEAAEKYGFKAFRQESNQGKGMAVRRALEEATGDAVIVQDADVEYDPADIPGLVEEYRKHGGEKAVYGSRNLGTNRYSYPSYYLGGRILTTFANLLYGLKLTDAFTGFKLVDRKLMNRCNLASKRFEFCGELTSKLTRMGVPIVEVPAHYKARSFAEGKKIRGSDGAIMAATFMRYRFWNPEGEWNALDRLLARWRLGLVAGDLDKGEAVLDIGCGRERGLCRLAKDRGLSYTGVDAAQEEKTQEGSALFLPGTLGDVPLPLPDNSFDKVVSLALLEHLDQPESLFREAYRVLRPGGKLLLTTPAPASKPFLEAMASLGIIDRVQIEDHKRYFSRKDIAELAAEYGFTDFGGHSFQGGLNNYFSAKKPE